MSHFTRSESLELLGPVLLDELPAARRLRRELHARPDLSGAEGPTRDLVLAALPGDVEHVAGTGALVRIGGAGPSVGVRAELDAMPISEATDVAWASRNGAMHACGHDVHLAALVALARAVSRVGGPAPMIAVLQPREETNPSGARDIVASGRLRDVTAMAAAHVHPAVAPGAVACAPGAVNAAADEFTVTITGSGGHAAYPQLARDPVLALAQFVVAAQQLISRDADPMVPSVVTVGALAAGSAANAIPDRATASGTIRAMSEDQRGRLHDRLRSVADGIAAAHGCSASVEVARGEPVLRNDPSLASSAELLLGAAGMRVAEPMRSCGADDFAFYGEVAPLLMLFVGVAGPGLHSSTFLPGEEAVDHVAFSLVAGYLAACSVADSDL